MSIAYLNIEMPAIRRGDTRTTIHVRASARLERGAVEGLLVQDNATGETFARLDLLDALGLDAVTRIEEQLREQPLISGRPRRGPLGIEARR